MNKIYNNNETVQCHICGGVPELIIQQGQHNISINVSICTGCGLVYLSPRWNKERYNTYYEQEYDNQYRPITSTKTYNQRYGKIIERLEAATEKRTFPVILDIGSGDGFTLDALKERYNSEKVSAIEPSLASQHILSEKGYEFLTTDVDTNWNSGQSNTFDLVIMRHVLEHLLYPVEALGKVADVLTPSGLAYIAVPDMMNPVGDISRYWFRVVHTYYYSEKTLLDTLALAGLQPITSAFYGYGEIAVIVKRSQNNQLNVTPDPSTYQKQMAVIKKAQRLSFAKRLLYLFKQFVKKLIKK